MNRHTIYQSCSPNGRVRDQATGLTVTVVDATHVTVPEAALDAARISPKAGDKICGTDGKWLSVTEVSAVAGGAYPLTVAAITGGK